MSPPVPRDRPAPRAQAPISRAWPYRRVATRGAALAVGLILIVTITWPFGPHGGVTVVAAPIGGRNASSAWISRTRGCRVLKRLLLGRAGFLVCRVPVVPGRQYRRRGVAGSGPSAPGPGGGVRLGVWTYGPGSASSRRCAMALGLRNFGIPVVVATAIVSFLKERGRSTADLAVVDLSFGVVRSLWSAPVRRRCPGSTGGRSGSGRRP
jgi:hypothetical protein